jgi:SAM-dependent methyltransferase/SOS-response transcriptional repressor LexA
MDPATANYYAKNAARLAGIYSQASMAYLDAIEAVFRDCRTILDVGCGTGRDCLHLLSTGKDAFGAEPSPDMLAKAKANFSEASLASEGRLFEAGLPKLEPFENASFDGVLCSGVLMHLRDEEIFDAVYGLKRVLRHGGILVVSIPQSRADVDPSTRRDPEGRLFTELPPAKLQLLFERVGFYVERAETTTDALGRCGFTWRTMVLRRLDEARDRPLHLVEGILNRDQKVATYKLALFRALSEIAQTQPHVARFTSEGKVTVPNETIAEKWLFYYWPIFAATMLIRQGTSSQGADVAIRPAMMPLIDHYAKSGGISAFYVDWRSGRMNADVRRLVNGALSQLKHTIWSMPVRHAGGGQFDVFQYDSSEKAVVMDASLWRELCLTGNWIQDATVLRWAELTEQINQGRIKASRVIDCLLTVPNEARNVADARQFYGEWEDRACVWTERSLSGSFEVDHAIPFSLWRNNDLWNLLPASDAANRSKSDRLPTYDLLHRRRALIIKCWRGLDEFFGERFRTEAQTFMGREILERTNWEGQLFSRFVEAFETTASQRGAARWDPDVAVRPRVPGASVIVPKPECSDEIEVPGPVLVPFDELENGAFRTHLPLVASLAAGRSFHGFDTGDLDFCEDLDWIMVPHTVAKERRFVVRVAGNSMEPLLRKGDFVVFEYHRSPREQNQVVIGNFPEFGRGVDGTEAIKRLRIESDAWVFVSENPEYEPVRVPKDDIHYPILGTMVMVLPREIGW